jgi:AcrR family transcriptional regulator
MIGAGCALAARDHSVTMWPLATTATNADPARSRRAAKPTSREADERRTIHVDMSSASTTRAKKPAGGLEIREAVTAAAERLFRERSPADVTLREIAAEASVNYSLVYRYFRTKDAVLASVFQPMIQKIRAHFVDAPAGRAALADIDVRDVHGYPGYARALAWALLEGIDLDLLFDDPDDESGDDRRQTPPSALGTPRTDEEIDSRVLIATFIVLSMGWDLYEPYLRRITGIGDDDSSVLNAHLARISGALLSLGEPDERVR